VHYYKLNIPTWTQSTRHLLPEEEGIYLRLVNHYYDTEQPFPEDLSAILRRLQLRPYKDIVDAILAEFFEKSDKGWQHKKIEHVLKDFRKKAKINKINGAKGGRPRRGIALKQTVSEPDGLKVGTQKKPTHNPNQEPITTNQEPLTKENKDDVLADANTGENTVSTKGAPFTEIAELWNIMAKKNDLPQVVKITTAMKGQIRQRHGDLEHDLNRWDNFFKYIAGNDWLAGRTPAARDRSTPFRATLLWVTKETNFQKIAAKEFEQ